MWRREKEEEKNKQFAFDRATERLIDEHKHNEINRQYSMEKMRRWRDSVVVVVFVSSSLFSPLEFERIFSSLGLVGNLLRSEPLSGKGVWTSQHTWRIDLHNPVKSQSTSQRSLFVWILWQRHLQLMLPRFGLLSAFLPRVSKPPMSARACVWVYSRILLLSKTIDNSLPLIQLAFYAVLSRFNW